MAAVVALAWQLAGAACQLRARRPPARLPGPSASRAVLGASQLAAQASIQHSRRRGGPRRAPEGRSKTGCAATAAAWVCCPCHEALAHCCSGRGAPAAAAGQELRFAPLTWSNGGAEGVFAVRRLLFGATRAAGVHVGACGGASSAGQPHARRQKKVGRSTTPIGLSSDPGASTTPISAPKHAARRC